MSIGTDMTFYEEDSEPRFKPGDRVTVVFAGVVSATTSPAVDPLESAISSIATILFDEAGCSAVAVDNGCPRCTWMRAMAELLPHAFDERGVPVAPHD